ncbi:MAG: nitrilase-related carbon-nitrogen hydrolase [bacterium]|jgi:predicted amidohydrolase
MKVGVLQFYPKFKDKEYNYKLIRDYLSDIKDSLIVLPELANTGYLFLDKSELIDLAEEVPNGKFTNILIDLAKKNNLIIVSGILEIEKNKFYNSAVIVNKYGYIGKYRKINLFYREKFIFEPGDKLEVFEVSINDKKINLGVMICFDWYFPEVSRNLMLKGADIIAHPANLVLPYCPLAMPIRALENKLYTITANRIGIEENNNEKLKFIGQSVICSPKAEYLLKLNDNQQGVFLVDIDLNIDKMNKNITKFNNLKEDLDFLYKRLNFSFMN